MQCIIKVLLMCLLCLSLNSATDGNINNTYDAIIQIITVDNKKLMNLQRTNQILGPLRQGWMQFLANGWQYRFLEIRNQSAIKNLNRMMTPNSLLSYICNQLLQWLLSDEIRKYGKLLKHLSVRKKGNLKCDSEGF